jgi:hypothetical protein
MVGRQRQRPDHTWGPQTRHAGEFCVGCPGAFAE